MIALILKSKSGTGSENCNFLRYEAKSHTCFKKLNRETSNKPEQNGYVYGNSTYDIF